MTAVKVTKDQLLSLDPCGADERLKLFGRRKALTASQALQAGASIEDLLWVAGRLGMKRECVQFALACAQRVAHLNSDPRVQGALDAAGAWLSDPSEDNLQRARAAARAAAEAAGAAAWAAARAAARAAAEAAAWAAAWAAAEAAAWAAGAAARAAAGDAAGAAARAAAWDAAWDAARAAAGDAAEAEQATQREIFLSIFG